MASTPSQLVAGLELDEAAAAPPAGEAVRGRVELLKLQFEYAWRDWQFNAQQRMTVFQFFVALTAAGAALLGVLAREGMYMGAAAASLLGAFLAAIFFLLDRRNEELLRESEDLLRTLEEEALFRDAHFTPPQRSRRWPLGLPAEQLPVQELPLGLRRRSDAERRLRAAALDGAGGDGWLRAFRLRIGLGLDGLSPYRFGFWLPAVEALVCAFLLVAAVAFLLLPAPARDATAAHGGGAPPPALQGTPSR